jgi:transposase InsO family protein
MQAKHLRNEEPRKILELKNGDAVLLSPEDQQQWKQRIMAESIEKEPTILLTFWDSTSQVLKTHENVKKTADSVELNELVTDPSNSGSSLVKAGSTANAAVTAALETQVAAAQVQFTRDRPFIVFKDGNEILISLLDTGGTVSLITESAAQRVAQQVDCSRKIKSADQPITIVGAGGARMPTSRGIMLELTKCGISIRHWAYIVPDGHFGDCVLLLGYGFQCPPENDRSPNRPEVTLIAKDRLLVFGHLRFKVSDSPSEALETYVSNKELLNPRDYKPIAELATISVDTDLTSETVPAHAARSPSRLVDDVKVTAECDLIIPRNTETKISGLVHWAYPENQSGVFQPAYEVADIAFAYALVDISKEGLIPILSINFSEQDVKIPKGTILGSYTTAVSELTTTPEVGVANTDLSKDQSESLPDNLLAQRKRDWENLVPQFDLGDLTDEQKEEFLLMLHRHQDVFSKDDYDLGEYPDYEAHIDTGNAAPQCARIYRIPFHQRKILDDHISDMLRIGVIRPSRSPWCAPVILVKRKPTGYRVVVDLRKLNSVTQMDCTPMPLIAEAIAGLNGTTIYSKLDFRFGFYQIKLAESSRAKTAFSTHRAHFEFCKIPMGLKTSAAVFQSVAYCVFNEILGDYAACYLDDVLLSSKFFQVHVIHVDHALTLVERSKMKLSPAKCSFGKKEVVFLGFLVNSKGVQPNPSKVSVVKNWPTPKTKKQVRQFLGATGFYRRHIKDFAEIAGCLYDLTKKTTPFLWTDEENKAFLALRQALAEAALLRHPDFSKQFILETDASNFSIGCCLSQTHGGINYPLAFSSRKLSSAECNYATTHREILAAAWGMKQYHTYLAGREFLLITDHSAIIWLTTSQRLNSRLERTLMDMREYTYVVQHRPGKDHVVADALSRIDAPICTIDFGSPSWTRQQLRAEQEVDPYCKDILERLGNIVQGDVIDVINGKHSFFRDTDGILFRILLAKPSAGRLKDANQMVIPQNLIPHCISEFHDLPQAGHRGRDKTLKAMQQRCFFPSMSKKVARYVKTCITCQEHRKPGKQLKARLRAFKPVLRPAAEWCMDLTGPYTPTTDSDMKYVLTIVCSFSRYLVAVPIPDKTAETVARALVKHIFLRFGSPSVIFSDCGSEFLNDILSAITWFLKIKQVQTTPRTSWANGKAEICNNSIVSIVRKIASTDIYHWDLFVDAAVWAYNSTVHQSTLLTPNFLFYGTDFHTPASILYEPNGISYGSDNFPVRLETRLKLAYKYVREANLKAEERNKRYYDRSAKEYSYKRDDLLFIKNYIYVKDLSPKLTRVWRGIYRVMELVNEVILRVVNINNPSDILRVHATNCKPAFLRHEAQPPAFQGLDDLDRKLEFRGELNAEEKRLKSYIQDLLLDPKDHESEIDITQIISQGQSVNPVPVTKSLDKTNSTYQERKHKMHEESVTTKRSHDHFTRASAKNPQENLRSSIKKARIS